MRGNSASLSSPLANTEALEGRSSLVSLVERDMMLVLFLLLSKLKNDLEKSPTFFQASGLARGVEKEVTFSPSPGDWNQNSMNHLSARLLPTCQKIEKSSSKKKPCSLKKFLKICLSLHEFSSPLHVANEIAFAL